MKHTKYWPSFAVQVVAILSLLSMEAYFAAGFYSLITGGLAILIRNTERKYTALLITEKLRGH